MVVGGRRKHHTSWEDGSEMVEEYDLACSRLVVRKVRSKSALGKLSDWTFLLGEAEKKAFNPRRDMISANSRNPEFIQQDTATHFQWRIRNIPYDRSVYRISIDQNKQQIVLRTTNKKYFKRINVPSMTALGEKLCDDQNVLTYTHSNNTLIIQYKKPKKVIQTEVQYAQARAKAAENASGGKSDETPDCKTQ